MKDFLTSLDWMTLFSTIWTIILLPISTQIYKWFASKQMDKYTSILYEEMTKSVKSVYETTVKDLKYTENWTEKTQNQVKELAKTKALQALSSIVYRSLKEANSDFDKYLDNLVGAVLYDIKHT